MKKIIVLLAGIIILGGVFAVYHKLTAKLPIEEVLPKGALFYLQVSDVEKNLKEFQETKLWQNIKNIDVERLMEKSGATPSQKEQFFKIKEEMTSTLSRLLLNEFFGRDIALAVYPSSLAGTVDAFGLEAFGEITSNVILVTRLKPNAEFIEFITKVYSKFGQDMETQTTTYKDYELTTVKLREPFHLTYVKIKDLLILGVGPKAAQSCVDVFLKEKISLAQDGDFRKTRAEFPRKIQTFMFGNLRLFVSQLLRLSDIAADKTMSLEEKINLTKVFDRVAGFETVGYASLEDKLSKDEFVVLFDKAKLDSQIAKLYSCEPTTNRTIRFVPQHVMLYQWSNCFDAKMGFEDMMSELAQEKKIDPEIPSRLEFLSELEKTLGLSVERDLIPLLGDEMGYLIADVDVKGIFPFPKIVFFMEVDDPGKTEGILARLTEERNFRLQPESYQGKTIKSMVLPLGGDFQPGYVFVDNYLLMATSAQLLREAVDSYQDESKSLLADEYFKVVNQGLTDPNNSVFFLRTDALIEKIQKVSEWGLAWLSLQGANLKAYQKGVEENLEDLEKDISTQESSLISLKTQTTTLKEEIKALYEQGLDTSAKDADLAKLEADMETLEDSLAELQERKQEAQKFIEESKKKSMDPVLVELYLKEVIFPILDGLASNKALGSRMTFEGSKIKSFSYAKWEE